MSRESEPRFGLSADVVFCKECVMSNQRPTSSIEFKHTKQHQHRTLFIDEDGVCDACRFNEMKAQIDWQKREEELLTLLDKHRSKDGSYDCLVPGSGGKDSVFAAHVLKYKYGMHPLTVTWPPFLYTDVGWHNFKSWIDVGGFDNITFKPNGVIHRKLTLLAIENLLHPFQTFILGQKNLAPKMAIQFGIPLIFYGESETEYGNPISESTTALRNTSYYTFNNLDEIYLAGLSVSELTEAHGFSLGDLLAYLPADYNALERMNIDVHYLGYYLKWTPQEAYYYAVEHTGFQANSIRSEGTYSKYNSLDDRIDGFHYYTTYIKFGLGRATYDASQEIRNRHLTRDEAISLVNRFDGEFPEKYFQEVLDTLGLTPERFLELCDQFRSPHLWENRGGTWRLRHKVS